MDKKITVGLDIGSLTAKIIVLESIISDNSNPKRPVVLYEKVVPVGANPQEMARDLWSIAKEKLSTKTNNLKVDYIVATGYGRKLVDFADKQITEITCHARGMHFLNNKIRTVIDVGGQDSKVIRLDDKGRVISFEMNDKCSAGTGRFLEVMSNALEVSIKDFGGLAVKSTEPVHISNTCTVFAESEVISYLNKSNINRIDVIAGIHHSIVDKILSIAARVGIEEEIAFSGEVAYNVGVIKILGERINKKIYVPPNPQICGALGAAISGLKFVGIDINHFNE